jgi:hypothetical protein
MLEIALFIAIFFLVLVFFYKQKADGFNILQIESDKLSTFHELLSEKFPIVVRGLGEPKFLTPEILKATPRLHGIQLAPTLFLGDILKGSAKLPSNLVLPDDLQKLLASEVGLHVWAEHSWLPHYSGENPSWFLSLDTKVNVGSIGLTKSSAYSTVLYPTSGTFTCSLMLDTAEKFLPTRWAGRYLSELTVSDTPLLKEIQFIDIILRPGHMLHIPAHWIYCCKAIDLSVLPLCGILEVHHPISKLASSLL